jgi:hypothetical protein
VSDVTVVAPHEEDALFNPAFLALVLREAAKEHETRTGGRPLPTILSYLVVPLALHRATREALPTNRRTQMGEWVRQHPELLVDLGRHARTLRPYVSRAACLGLRHGVLVAREDGLSAGPINRRPRGMARDADVDDCVRKAGFLGRWFAGQPDVVTTLAIWGLRP